MMADGSQRGGYGGGFKDRQGKLRWSSPPPTFET